MKHLKLLNIGNLKEPVIWVAPLSEDLGTLVLRSCVPNRLGFRAELSVHLYHLPRLQVEQEGHTHRGVELGQTKAWGEIHLTSCPYWDHKQDTWPPRVSNLICQLSEIKMSTY